ncbi:hypothetical protein AWENTII_005711 [Aspergillus wentii]
MVAAETQPDGQNASKSSIHEEIQDAPLDKNTDQPIAPDQFDEKYHTTKWEIWAYYSCVMD